MASFLVPYPQNKKTEKEAMQIAFAWLRDGIPKKQTALTVQDLSFKEMILICICKIVFNINME